MQQGVYRVMIATLGFLSTLLLAPARQIVNLDIEGTTRKAIVILPNTSQPAPVVFAFHGHGGNMNFSERKFAVEKLWPEAAVVYMQGIPTATPNDPEGKRNGWQVRSATDNQRDLKFFDKMLEWVKAKQNVDTKRVYALGHSNGAAFTYLLWSTHPGTFAAIAPIAGGFAVADKPSPIPVLHIAGKNDPIVKYENQVRTVERMRRFNECGTASKPWDVKGSEIWASPKGAPVIFYSHEGKHEVPENAMKLILKFFQEHPAKPWLCG